MTPDESTTGIGADRRRPVVCAVEDTVIAQHAAQAAAWLARDLGAPLVLVHAFDPMGIKVPSMRELTALSLTAQDLENAARERAHRLLEGAAEAVDGPEVTTELLEGQPVPELTDFATSAAELLVTGTAARTGLDRLLVGSVSGELAGRAPCPVVAVPPRALLEQAGPVVAGYDGSDHSLRAARYGAALAARLGRGLVLLHARGARDEGVRPDRDLGNTLYRAAVDALGAGPDREPLDLEVSVAVEEGDPLEVLAHTARERAAVLVVTGSRGRNALTGALLGSVSAGLIGAAERPVMLVPESAVRPAAGLD